MRLSEGIAREKIQFSIIIATYNRAESLSSTLRSLAEATLLGEAEVIIVDNNSSDETHKVVADAMADFPTELRYVHEAKQGRSAALNAGIEVSRGEIILITDDDVRIDAGWIVAASRAFRTLDCDYLGGKVLPIWEGGRPSWLPDRGGKHWAVIALLDYGPDVVELDKQVPLGVNMGFKRESFVKAGLWDNRIGRKGGTLLGQEVREWGLRARSVNLKGFYIPDMIVHHIIPSDRLKKSYFRRWFYWHGISRAILFDQTGADMEAPEETSLDFSLVPKIAGVPRYLYRSCLSSFARMLVSAFRRDWVQTFERELWLWFFAGIVVQRWKDRRPHS